MNKKLRYVLLMTSLLLSLHGAKAQAIVVEAETGTLHGNVSIQTTFTGYTGTGYLGGFEATDGTDYATVNFTVVTAGLYDITAVYQSPYSDKGMDFKVNGVGGSITLTLSTVFTTKSIGKFMLPVGVSTIEIDRGWGYFFIDAFSIAPAVVAPPAKPTTQLSDANVTCNTQALFNFLVDQYGQKVLTGQQDLVDIEYVHTTTGKYPAVGSFDLIEYSPTRRQNGSNPANLSESAIAWSKSANGNGIVSLMWHWNAPADLVNTTDIPWWKGFYAIGTTFDLKAALADTTSAKYKLLISDMDSIAVQLKKFSNANVPVLWRPLHEVYSGGFWWGVQGAAPFIELWQLMYSRYTKVHKLHNLIWVWTGGSNVDMTYYPGDAYVDVVGLDLYTASGSSFSGSWGDAQTILSGKKLLALTETGTLPIPESPRTYGTWWSWFATWSGTYIRNWSADSLTALYTHADFLTLDELPNWKTDYAPASCLTAVNDASNAATVTVYPNPAQDYVIIEAENIRRIEIVNHLGQTLASHAPETSDAQRVSVESLPEGMYFMKIIYKDYVVFVRPFVKSK
jgi:mannan endo-1,4-beta-mannosidase